MIAEKSAYLLKYLLEFFHGVFHYDFSFFILNIFVLYFIFTYLIVVPTAGTCIINALTRRSRLRYVYRCLLDLQQSNKFRINAACTSRFLGGKYIIITVSWCFTMQDFSRKTKNSSQKASKRKRTDTHNECLSFSRKEDCEYGYCCTTYTGNGVGIFGTIIILCHSQAMSTPISTKK